MYNPYNPEADNTITGINEIIRNFKKYLNLQKIAGGSIRSYLSDVRFFFNWLIEFLLEKRILNLGEDEKWEMGREVRMRSEEKENTHPHISHPDSHLTSQPHISLLLKYITEAVLNAYKNCLEANNSPIKTINRRFSALRKFGSFCLSQNWLTVNTFDTLRNISLNTPFPESIYHLGEFKANLWKENSTKLTIKNYLCDVKQFINWTNKTNEN